MIAVTLRLTGNPEYTLNAHKIAIVPDPFSEKVVVWGIDIEGDPFGPYLAEKVLGIEMISKSE